LVEVLVTAFDPVVPVVLVVTPAPPAPPVPSSSTAMAPHPDEKTSVKRPALTVVRS